MTIDIIQQTVIDLQEDFEELTYLYQSYLVKLNTFARQLNRNQSFFHADIRELLNSECKRYIQLLKYHIKELSNISVDTSILGIQKFTSLKDKYYQLLRNYLPLITSLISSSDYQSPSYNHSLFSNAGRQTGKITGTINDYKRDQHLDGIELEKAYLREYIDAPFKFSLKCYATASGMAAFSTILNYLIMEKHAQGNILMGENSYFENKDLLHKVFSNNLIIVNENNTDEIIRAINLHQPSVIFLDSLSNTSNIAIPNLSQITNYLIANYKKEVYLIIDNTCLSVFNQPFKSIIGKRSKVNIISFESLNKYLQFGMDKTTGGMITAYGKDSGKLYHYRDHLGTNITDISSIMIPAPNRQLLERRLLRHQRNASLLSSFLQEYINNKSVIKQVNYPGLVYHSGNYLVNKSGFAGSFFTLDFKKKSTSLYKKFIRNVLNEARKRKISIVAGTSFGLNTTRIYLTSLRTDFGEPFVRVSLGTENKWEMEVIKEVFRSILY